MLEWLLPNEASARAAFWVITVASMTNVACALLGCYLVLRQMSLLGDAISHAVLPGLVMAFIFSGSLGIVPMFLGALSVGLLTTFLTQFVNRTGGVPADASMGVVFTSLFALGVVLVHRYASDVHIDTECVLEGLLEYVGVEGMNSIMIAGVNVPRQFVTITPILLLNVAFVVLFWKELKISSFDPGLATTMGFRSGLMHYLLMALVALTTVASFEAVGSILVVAMLIVPGATAHLLCDRLGRMVLVAVATAIAMAVVGFGLATYYDTNTSGMIAVVAGIFYLSAVFVSPRHGILSTLRRNLHTSLRILREDLLAMLYRLEELASERRMTSRDAVQAVGSGPLAWWSLVTLWRTGCLERSDAGLALTSVGRQQAKRLVRSHRLWEAYLVQFLGLPADHVHAPAERMEHYIDEGLQKQLAKELDDTSVDPHGRSIP